MRLLGAAIVLFSLGGCGPDCRSSCEKLYGDAAEECDINVASASGEQGADELIRECTAYCEDAMSKAGELGSYDPNNTKGDMESVSLDNEVQAAAWMECVDQTACEELKSGYCPPHHR